MKLQKGFSRSDSIVFFAFFAAIVITLAFVIKGVPWAARQGTMDIDISSLQTAVSAYVLDSYAWPTVGGKLPTSGDYALIDFNASNSGYDFRDYVTSKFGSMPHHWDEEVWRLDSAGKVSINIREGEY